MSSFTSEFLPETVTTHAGLVQGLTCVNKPTKGRKHHFLITNQALCNWYQLGEAGRQGHHFSSVKQDWCINNIPGQASCPRVVGQCNLLFMFSYALFVCVWSGFASFLPSCLPACLPACLTSCLPSFPSFIH